MPPIFVIKNKNKIFNLKLQHRMNLLFFFFAQNLSSSTFCVLRVGNIWRKTCVCAIQWNILQRQEFSKHSWASPRVTPPVFVPPAYFSTPPLYTYIDASFNTFTMRVLFREVHSPHTHTHLIFTLRQLSFIISLFLSHTPLALSRSTSLSRLFFSW